MYGSLIMPLEKQKKKKYQAELVSHKFELRTKTCDY